MVFVSVIESILIAYVCGQDKQEYKTDQQEHKNTNT